ncbi:hypothetical protein [Ornithinicoccus halotolerans]|uniref:hypothetical protein n=1 Tax=Ornithinicoccus halotolerans TaxID=1748220 RepID=UPI001294D159|nr:hypothetical protein [Ornithinicoccus halotolerans]
MADQRTATSHSTSATVTGPRHQLVNNPDEILHLVCCRDPEWKVAFCGEDGGHINVTAETLCTMCVEYIEERVPGFLGSDERVCPVDYRQCPEEHQVNLRILREVSP